MNQISGKYLKMDEQIKMQNFWYNLDSIFSPMA